MAIDAVRRQLPVLVLGAAQRRSFAQLLRKFTARSQVHGLQRLLQPNMPRRRRLLWSLAIIGACIMLIHVCYLLGSRYNRVAFRTFFQRTHWLVNKIDFPVVVICNKNRLNWSRLPEVIQSYNVSPAQRPLFEQVLTYYDALSFGRFNFFEPLAKQSHLLDSLNHLNFTQIVSELAWRCNELLSHCQWLGQPMDCCQLFRVRRIQQGNCLAFNEFNTRRTLETGVGSGLQVHLHLKGSQHAPKNLRQKGFRIYIMENGVWVGFPIELFSYTRNNIAITVRYHFYASATRSVPSQKRGCVFPDEYEEAGLKTLQGYPYMLENCQSECEQQHLLQYCNCTMDLFYPPSDYRACQLVDLPCLAKHNRYLKYFEEPGEREYLHMKETGMTCHCPYNCQSIELITDSITSISGPWDPGANWSASNGKILNIFYKKSGIFVYETNLVYTWIDLLASFGGIFQLCLGCSIISLVELIFFAFGDVPRFWWQRIAT